MASKPIDVPFDDGFLVPSQMSWTVCELFARPLAENTNLGAPEEIA